jgi:hypothetical protein
VYKDLKKEVRDNFFNEFKVKGRSSPLKEIMGQYCFDVNGVGFLFNIRLWNSVS